jgi:5'-nucleotidase
MTAVIHADQSDPSQIVQPPQRLVVAISSRALFDFEEENRVFEENNDTAYQQLQLDRLELPAPAGVAFTLVKKLLAFNVAWAAWKEQQGNGKVDEKSLPVEVVILSRNDPVSGLRVFKSAKALGLDLSRGVFTRGRSPWHYLNALEANLFLSTNSDDVKQALEAGFPAALVYPESARSRNEHLDEVRIAFDGDAVLFSDEAERVYQAGGLFAFHEHEAEHVARPLPPGPFKPLLAALHQLQRMAGRDTPMRVRTALVTARSAPAHERAIKTLMSWNIEVDEAMFLGGMDKGKFLKEFAPDFFFDDQTRHCQSAAKVSPTGQVLSDLAL